LAPQQFHLERGVTVNIYKRIRPTSIETAFRTLVAMENYVGERPGGQLSWLVLSQVPGYYIDRNNDNTYNINFYSQRAAQPITTPLVYLDTPTSKTVVTGQLSFDNQQCPSLALNLISTNAQGRIVGHELASKSFTSPSKFEITIQPADETYLMLNVLDINNQQEQSSHCSWSISQLAVLTADSGS
jgi:hypothetical protein